MKISQRGLGLILEFENKLEKLKDGRYRAYRCPAGVPTIFAGCTEGVFMGMVVTEAEGEAMFAREIARFERCVTLACTREPNQNQFDSFVSLAFNIGEAGFKGSSVLRHFNAGRIDKAAAAFALWNKARKNGRGPLVEMRGLTRRRKAEAALFMAPVETDEPDPMPQKIEPPQETATGSIAAGTATGGIVGNFALGDPVGVTSAAVAVKANAGQLFSGVDLALWTVPLMLGGVAIGILVYLNRRAS